MATVKTEIALEPGIDRTREYREGWQAWKDSGICDPYDSGEDTRACPYPCGAGQNDRRTRFLAGWWTGYVTDWLERFEARRQTAGSSG